MSTIETFNKYYVKFDNIRQFTAILDRYKALGFTYKNGSYDDAIDVAESTAVDKVTFKNGFVMTSKCKNRTLDYSTFIKITDGASTVNSLLNPNNNTPMSTTARNTRSALNSIRAKKSFEDEKFLEGLVSKAESAETVLKNFTAVMNKAQAKGAKMESLLNAFDSAVSAQDMDEIKRLGTLIDSSVKYITKANKVLAAVESAGASVVKADTKDASEDGEKFIGE